MIEAQLGDVQYEIIRDRIQHSELSSDWTEDTTHVLRFQGRLVVPEACQEDVLREFHQSRLAVHPGGTKMYQGVR